MKITITGWTFMICIIALNVTAQPKNERLNEVFERYYEDMKIMSPINATFLGDHRFDGQLANDGAADYLRQRHQLNIKYLTLLKGYKSADLNTADRISFNVLKELVDMDLQSESYHLEYMPVNQFSSIPLLMGQLGSGASAQPFETVQDYENWLKRIEDFRLYIDTAIANMRKAIKAHIVLPKDLVIKMIPQMEDLGQTDSTKSVFYGPLRKFPVSFSAADKRYLREAYQVTFKTKLFPAYRRLADFLKTDYLANATNAPGFARG